MGLIRTADWTVKESELVEQNCSQRIQLSSSEANERV